MWTCQKCKAEMEEAFDVCWSCGVSRDGVEDPAFPGVKEAVARDVAGQEEERARPAFQQKPCPDCQVPLVPIHVSPDSEYSAGIGLDYTVLESPGPPRLLGDRPAEEWGSIQAYMCTRCRRVLFYAHPGWDSVSWKRWLKGYR